MNKNKRVKYFDISSTIFNFIVMILITVLVFSDITLTIICIFSTTFLFGLTIVSYSRKNPYYILPSYGMAICGLLLSIVLLMTPTLPLNEFFVIIFFVIIVLDFIYIASLMKLTGGSYKRMSGLNYLGNIIDPNPDVHIYLKDRFKPPGNDKANKAVELEQRRAIRKEYYMDWILIITLIFAFMFSSTIILSLL
ncbi:MAG: hypothetical protein MUP85_22770 [Candidatus Lokiarchaeota archaeon]|nr:hypothetical protein [Candidatus Lokiarchaeota archaeon]